LLVVNNNGKQQQRCCGSDISLQCIVEEASFDTNKHLAPTHAYTLCRKRGPAFQLPPFRFSNKIVTKFKEKILVKISL